MGLRRERCYQKGVVKNHENALNKLKDRRKKERKKKKERKERKKGEREEGGRGE